MKAALMLGKRRLNYLLRDLFTTDRAGGAVNATAAEPGPGVRTVTDTENKLAVSAGKLVFAGGKAAPAWGDPGLWEPAIVRVAGQTLQVNLTFAASNKEFALGFSDVQNGLSNSNGFYFQTSGGIVLQPGNALTIGAYAGSVEYKFAVVLRSVGGFNLVKGGLYSEWTLLWADPSNARSPIYSALTNNSAAPSISKLVTAHLYSPWNTDYGIATQRLSGARSAEDTFVHEADCLIEWVVTTRAAGQQVAVRLQDASNYWRVDVAADGSMALQEVVAGTPTSRGTAAAASVANGQRVVVVAAGTTIKVIANNVAKITYASATNFATATQGSVLALGTGGAISDVVTWPRVLSGAALSALNRLDP